MSKEIELLAEIRDLLQVIAEPQLAARDKKLRTALREVVGSSGKKQGAVVLMDGNRTQTAISNEARIDKGQLSRLVKSLSKEMLIDSDEKHPKLLVKVPQSFFDMDATDE